MRSSRLGFSLYLLPLVLLAACVGNADVGGPRPDSSDGSTADTSSTTPQNDASATDAGGDASSPIDQAYAYAKGDLSCTADTDCCVVIDGCLNEGLVVTAAEQAKVASLLAEFDQNAMTHPSAGNECNGCIVPPVQVACVHGQCVGTMVDMFSPDGGVPDLTPFYKNHCGSLPNAPETKMTGTILGC
jgi:hypothetical protein